MTITEAKKLLRQDIDDPGSVDIMDINKAEQLGIEALEVVQKVVSTLPAWKGFTLPSQTKEERKPG